jgi:hypothetical protein
LTLPHQLQGPFAAKFHSGRAHLPGFCPTSSVTSAYWIAEAACSTFGLLNAAKFTPAKIELPTQGLGTFGPDHEGRRTNSS